LSYGFNLFDLRLPAKGEVRRVIVANDDFAANPQKPARNGIPILFPFPGRIRDGRYSFEGKDYALFIEPDKVHAIHGFAYNVPWDLVDSGATDQGAFLEGRFQISKNAPNRLDSWPTDAVLTVRYTLAGRRLEMTVTVDNPTDRDLPFGSRSRRRTRRGAGWSCPPRRSGPSTRAFQAASGPRSTQGLTSGAVVRPSGATSTTS